MKTTLLHIAQSAQRFGSSILAAALLAVSVPGAAKAQAPDFSAAARATRPTLVVLIHGGTARPEASPMPFEPSGADKRPGTTGYSRFYFDFPFVSRLLGNSSQLFTLPGGAVGGLTQSTWKVRFENNNIAHQFAFAQNPQPLQGRFGGNAVGLVRSNGSQALGLQAKEVLDEIRALYDRFQTFSGRRPYVVLVGHSKGGLIARYLMSIPNGTVAGYTLTPADRAFLIFLRDQTKFCVTIGSPHTGSPLADYADDFRSQTVASLENLVNGVWNAARAAASVVRINLPAAAPINVRAGARDLLGSEHDLGHLTTQFWNTMNNGPLHPSRMVRSNNAGRVPFYLYGGRSPGDVFYSLQRFDGQGGPAAEVVLNRNHPEHVGVMMTTALIGLDYSLHNVVNGDWGRIRSLGAGKNLDMVRRAFPIWGLPANRMSNPGERLFLIGKEGTPTYFLRNQADRETDSDGMVSMDSALAIGLFTGPTIIESLQAQGLPVASTLAEPWERNVNTAPAGQPFQGGAWYRRYTGAWNFQNHSTLVKRPELGVELNQLLLRAGPFARPTGDVSAW
jgi:hypothetical protein